MKSRGALILLVLVGLVIPGVADAQTRIELGLFAGAFLPLGDLTDPFGSSQIVQSHDAAIAFGGRVGARMSRVSVEGSVAWTPSKLVSESSAVSVSEDQNILMFGLDVLLDLSSGAFFEPFLAVGAGGKTYSIDDPLSPPGFEAGTDFMFNVGAGGRLWITQSAAIRIDVRDYISTFDAFELISSATEDAKLQNDLLITVGISITPGS